MNLRFPSIIFITFDGIGSTDIDVFNTQPKYVTCAFCFIFISLYLTVGLQIFLALSFFEKRIELALSFPRKNTYFVIYKPVTNIFKAFIKYFFNFVMSLCLYVRHESSAYKSKFDFTA